MCTFIGVVDYIATGSLSQLASRLGGIIPNFYFLGQALSGVILFIFTSSVDWKLGHLAQSDHGHNHLRVETFFMYTTGFVLMGWVASNLLLRTEPVLAFMGPLAHIAEEEVVSRELASQAAQAATTNDKHLQGPTAAHRRPTREPNTKATPTVDLANRTDHRHVSQFRRSMDTVRLNFNFCPLANN